jgi:hypothetical protein
VSYTTPLLGDRPTESTDTRAAPFRGWAPRESPPDHFVQHLGFVEQARLRWGTIERIYDDVPRFSKANTYILPADASACRIYMCTLGWCTQEPFAPVSWRRTRIQCAENRQRMIESRSQSTEPPRTNTVPKFRYMVQIRNRPIGTSRGQARELNADQAEYSSGESSPSAPRTCWGVQVTAVSLLDSAAQAY